MRLADKVVVLTGASSGLGRHLAEFLAREGAVVVAAARRKDRLDELAALAPTIVPHPCDITDADQVDALVARCHADLGRIDVLINNAGTSVQEPSETADMARFRSVIDLNLVAQFGVTRAVAGAMLERGSGSIVNIASIFGLVASAPIQQAAYAASKGGLITLTRQLAAEWASRGVRVNAIAPGWFPSELTEELFGSERGMAWLRRNTPIGRAGDPTELDGAVALLAGTEGSFITGAVLTVDGGWTAR